MFHYLILSRIARMYILFSSAHVCGGDSQVDAMLHKLEKELDDVDEKIGDRWRVLDR